ncbi:MAG: MFS transporter [Verrucomicrobiia bacterium]
MNLALNLPLFIAFRIGFNARFYYPIISVFFIDLGLTLEQYTLLNLVWALTIVTCELPSGALADLVGRRTLVRAAATLMVVEMLVLLLAPASSSWLFPVLLLNRLLSGLAEACASGADEALAFDSLPPGPDRDPHWARTLATLGRCQSASFLLVMLIGAAAYDPALVGTSGGSPSRWPIALTLLMALTAASASWAMREPPRHALPSSPWLLRPWRQIVETSRWIAHTPTVLALLASGLALDSVIRLFLTLQSNFLRMLGYAEGWFGALAAGFSLVAFLTPALARRLVHSLPPVANFILAAILALLAFLLISAPNRFLATLALAPLAAAMSLNNFFIAYYLNRAADSTHRATLLSFRGMAYNLAFGFVALAYAAAVASLRQLTHFPDENATFRAALPLFPLLFLALITLAIHFGWRARPRPKRS